MVGPDSVSSTFAAVGVFEHAEVIFVEGNISPKGSWGKQMDTQINNT